MSGAHDRLAEMLEHARCAAVHLRKTPAADDTGAPGCWLGGEPTLPAEIDWPHYTRGHGQQVPMHFLGQIDLAQLPRPASAPDLPSHGTLFFFYDTIFAPVENLKRAGSKVLYVEDEVSHNAPRPTPQMPDTSDEEDISFIYQENPTQGYRRWNLTFELVETVDFNKFDEPEFWTAAIAEYRAGLATLERATSTDRKRSFSDGHSAHFTPHYFFGDGERSLWQLADDDVPLLRLFSDPDIWFGHGDLISIVFWISKADLAARNFDNAFLVDRIS